jgi:hypothetical protein
MKIREEANVRDEDRELSRLRDASVFATLRRDRSSRQGMEDGGRPSCSFSAFRRSGRRMKSEAKICAYLRISADKSADMRITAKKFIATAEGGGTKVPVVPIVPIISTQKLKEEVRDTAETNQNRLKQTKTNHFLSFLEKSGTRCGSGRRITASDFASLIT